MLQKETVFGRRESSGGITGYTSSSIDDCRMIVPSIDMSSPSAAENSVFTSVGTTLEAVSMTDIAYGNVIGSSWHSAGKFHTSKLGSSSATRVTDASLLVTLRISTKSRCQCLHP